jgi:glycine oxidase
MSRGPKVTVAGAGALGLTTALALADAGCAVTVCDPQGFGRASSVAAGMLAPVFEAVLEPEVSGDVGLLLAARNLWPGLEARAGVALDRSGAFAVGDQAWLDDLSAGLVRLGVRGVELPPATIEALAPGLAAAFQRGLLVRDDWRLEPRPALAALRAAAEAAGVAFRTEAVTGRGEADVLVLASGYAPLAQLAPELALLSPIKGQILRFADGWAGRVSLRAQGAYAVPGPDGLAVGGTMETGRDDLQPDPQALAPLSRAAGRLFPRLAEATFGVQAGVRAATPDGLPLAGCSAAPGVVLATGARRNGWLLAPLIAQVVTACVTGRDAGPYAARFDPQRFAGRSDSAGAA